MSSANDNAAAYEFVPFPQIDILINDHSLPLREIEDFSTAYTTMTGARVQLNLRWGGPAAGGPGWGGPEIAVIILVGELLRRGTSDIYDLVKSFALDAYTRIRTRNAARWYIDGAMALAVDSPTKATRLLFCFPEGLDQVGVRERIRLVEEHQQELLNQWDGRGEVKLCWKDDVAGWVECQPYPDSEERS